MLRFLSLALATGFGLGFSPFASGTVGTLLGVLIVAAMGFLNVGIVLHIVIAVLLPIIAIPICGDAEKFFGKKDDGRIVADEYMTFPLCVIGMPYFTQPWLLIWAFLFHRFFDIWKPPPARQLQKLTGGLGVVIDDVASSIYALIATQAIWQGYKWYFL